jgi:hypothetical protein
MKHCARILITCITLGVLLIGFIPLQTTTPTVKAAKLLYFNSFLEMTVTNISTINDAVFRPDGPPVNIPLTIKYRVEIPPAFMTNTLLRIIFLQTFIILSAQVQLTIENPPAWAAVSINPSSPAVAIDTQWNYTQAVVTIAPHDDAPAEGFTLKIKAATPEILNRHVGPSTTTYDLVFQPGYTPLIDVYTTNPNRIVGPQDPVSFPIVITNKGNKQTLVTARITSSIPQGWTPLLSSSQITINSAANGANTGTLVFTITPPYGTGWHDDIQTFTLEFTPQFSPPQPDNPNYVGTPVPFQVTVRSRGFSTPGFEAPIMLIAVGITLALMIAMKTRKHT